MTDLLWAWRSLWRSPGLTVAAVLTCALGVGANVALLSVVDRLMFRPLPYGEPHRLVQLHDRTMGVANPFASLPQHVGREIKARSSSFEGIAHARVATSARVVAGLGEAPVVLASGSDNLLPLLGVRLLLGDHPAGIDLRPRGPHSLLLTADTWRTRFGGRADVLGTPLASEEGIRYEVAGVLPPDFLLPSSDFAERIAGLIIQTNSLDEPPSPFELIVAPVARLRRGVSLAQAQAEVDVLYAQVHAPTRGMRAAERIVVQPLQQGLYFLYGPQLRLVVLAGAIVLLIACVNLSTLLLARNRSAERSTAIRLALGASSRRVFAASAFEALLVCAAGSALAIVACLWAQHLLLSVVPPIFRGFAVSALDLRLLAVALATTVVMAFAISLAPTWRALRVDAGKVLQAGGRSGEGRLRGGSSLLAVQAALGVALVAGAMLTVGSYVRLVLVDTGFAEDDLYVVDVPHGYDPARPQDNATVRAREVIEITASLPGVAAVGVVSRRPFGRFSLAAGPWDQWGHSGGTWGFSSGAFAAMGLSLRAGRTFSDDEVAARALVAVLNEAAVRVLWPDTAPSGAIGRTITTADGERRVVGVVGDVRRYPGEGPIPSLFLPISAHENTMAQSALQLLVRMHPGQTFTSELLNARLDERFGARRLQRPESAVALQATWLERPRFVAAIVGTTAGIALLLAAIGVFALASFDAARRRHEMAIRSALGATAADLRRLVRRGVVRPVLAGALAGLLVSWWAARFVQSLIVDLDARHPVIHGAVLVLLVSVAALAAWLPARRASRVDPAETFRAM